MPRWKHYDMVVPQHESAHVQVAREDSYLDGESVKVGVDTTHRSGETVHMRVTGWSVMGADGEPYIVARGTVA
jgi:hypothetical protein